jgi:hypothetical protein
MKLITKPSSIFRTIHHSQKLAAPRRIPKKISSTKRYNKLPEEA